MQIGPKIDEMGAYACIAYRTTYCFSRYLYFYFFKPTDAIRVAVSPRIGVGPGFDSQGSVNFFTKYCFPNLH